MLLRRGCNQDVCAAVSLTLHVVTCGSDPDSCVGDCGVLPVAVGQMCLTLFFFPECLADQLLKLLICCHSQLYQQKQNQNKEEQEEEKKEKKERKTCFFSKQSGRFLVFGGSWAIAKCLFTDSVIIMTQ